MSEYILKGKILPFNIKSSVHNRVYTKESIQEAFDEFGEKVSNGEMFGCLESRHFPSVEVTGNVPIECISHQIIDANIDDDGVEVTIKVLDTKEGRIVKQLMDHDIAIWGGITGFGAQREDGIMELGSISCVNLTCCPSFNPDEYPPMMPEGASSDILKKELIDQARRKKLMKKSNEHDE